MGKVKYNTSVGDRFGRLTITYRDKFYIICKCDCGNEWSGSQAIVARGQVRSCGCGRVAAQLSHGLSGSRAYHVWEAMVARCTNPNMHAYHRYGGRGIGMCEEWRTFSNFFRDMGHPPEGYHIDRIDNEKGYCKENCRWVTAKTNMRNRSKHNYVEYEGRKITTEELADILGVSGTTVRNRLRIGWNIKDLGKPVKPCRRKPKSTKEEQT